METTWKRPKTLEGQTEQIQTNCGSLYFTLNYDEGKLVEVRGIMGKSGICCGTLIDVICKLISIYLQSPEPRYKICKKFRKQFIHEKDKDMTCGNDPFMHEGKQYVSCVDYIAKRVERELGE